MAVAIAGIVQLLLALRCYLATIAVCHEWVSLQ